MDAPQIDPECRVPVRPFSLFRFVLLLSAFTLPSLAAGRYLLHHPPAAPASTPRTQPVTLLKARAIDLPEVEPQIAARPVGRNPSLRNNPAPQPLPATVTRPRPPAPEPDSFAPIVITVDTGEPAPGDDKKNKVVPGPERPQNLPDAPQVLPSSPKEKSAPMPKKTTPPGPAPALEFPSPNRPAVPAPKAALPEVTPAPAASPQDAATGGNRRVSLKVLVVEMSCASARQLGIEVGHAGCAAASPGSPGAETLLAGSFATVSAPGLCEVAYEDDIAADGQALLAINTFRCRHCARCARPAQRIDLYGHPATILAGGQFPLGPDTGRIALVLNGVSLTLKPLAVDSERLQLDVSATCGEAVAATVDLCPGQSVALAGLFPVSFCAERHKPCFLSRIFSSCLRDTPGDEEIVVLIAPEFAGTR